MDKVSFKLTDRARNSIFIRKRPSSDTTSGFQNGDRVISGVDQLPGCT